MSMSNDAQHLESLLAEYVDGALDPASAKFVEEHLAANPATRAVVEQMKLDRDAVRSLPRVNAPADLSEDLRGRLERDLLLNVDPIVAARARRFSPPVAALAAMLMVGLGVAGIAYVLLSDRPQPYLATSRGEGLATQPVAEGSGDLQTRRISATAPPLEDASASVADRTPPNESKDLAAGENESARSVTPDEPPAAVIAASPVPSVPEIGRAAATDAQLPQVASGHVAIDAVQPPPSFEVSDDAMPSEAASAIAGRALDPSRRSVVVVVDQSRALDALAFATRVAGEREDALEVTEAGDALAARKRIATTTPASEADVALVAKGLNEPSAMLFQQELRRVDAASSTVFDVTPIAAVADRLEDASATTQASSTQAGMPVEKVVGGAMQQYEPRQTFARQQAATTPSDAPPTSPGIIRNGERLRVTLTDPDAFDLRTQHEVTVDSAGNVSLPSLDGVPAAGKSAESLRGEIVDAYRNAKLMRRPVVKVESIDSGAASRDPNQLIDLYVVVRSAKPTSQPASQPATLPTTLPVP